MKIMSFVARVRSTVKSNSETFDDSSESPELDFTRGFENAIPTSLHPKTSVVLQHNSLPDLDPDELSGLGARAILTTAASLPAAKFVGANIAFCEQFGFSRAELPVSSFRILQVFPQLVSINRQERNL